MALIETISNYVRLRKYTEYLQIGTPMLDNPISGVHSANKTLLDSSPSGMPADQALKKNISLEINGFGKYDIILIANNSGGEKEKLAESIKQAMTLLARGGVILIDNAFPRTMNQIQHQGNGGITLWNLFKAWADDYKPDEKSESQRTKPVMYSGMPYNKAVFIIDFGKANMYKAGFVASDKPVASEKKTGETDWSSLMIELLVDKEHAIGYQNNINNDYAYTDQHTTLDPKEYVTWINQNLSTNTNVKSSSSKEVPVLPTDSSSQAGLASDASGQDSKTVARVDKQPDSRKK